MQLSPLSRIVNPWGSPTLDGLDIENAQPNQRVGANSSSRQFVQFFKKTVRDYKFAGVGKPAEVIESEREFVKIVTPGDKNIVEDFAQDFHKREHWKHYNAFRQGAGDPIGKSIDECPYVSSAIALELKFHQVHTEEQLADASDHLCGLIPNGYELREFARAEIQTAAKDSNKAEVNLLKAQLEQSNGILAEMQRQIEELRKSAESNTDTTEKAQAKLKKAKGDE